MRTITTIFATLLIVAVCSGCAARRTANISVDASARSLVGTWEIVSQQNVPFPENSPTARLKMFNETHFATITYNRATGAVTIMNGGAYTLDGETLIEYIVFSTHDTQQMAGRAVDIAIEFRGDNEIQMTGIGVRFVEVWRRVETEKEQPTPDTYIANSLDGTWELTLIHRSDYYPIIVTEDSPVVFKRMFNDTHFVTVIYSTAGHVSVVNGGTFTFNGEELIEHTMFAAGIDRINHNTQFSIAFDGDDEFQATNLWSDDGAVVTEMYRRMDAERAILMSTPSEYEDPQFPGGRDALNQFLSENLVRPAVPNLQGRVAVAFIVGRDGSISDISVVQSLSPAHDQEVIRVIQAMPRWRPGTHNGEPVRVRFTLPVTFR